MELSIFNCSEILHFAEKETIYVWTQKYSLVSKFYIVGLHDKINLCTAVGWPTIFLLFDFFPHSNVDMFACVNVWIIKENQKMICSENFAKIMSVIMTYAE